MPQLRDYFWRIVQLLPLVFIAAHIHIAITYGPGNLYLTLWILESIWIFLYFIAQLVVFKPTSGGFWYLTIFIATNSIWEVWISYLVLDEKRLVISVLPVLILMILYFNRQRFAAKQLQSSIALAIIAFIMTEALIFGLEIEKNKQIREISQWSIQSTGQIGLEMSDIKWSGPSDIVARFKQAVPDVSTSLKQPVMIIGRLDINSGKMDVIDSSGHSSTCSSDGQWVAYIQRKPSEGKKEIQHYIRYHVPSGKHEVVLQGSFRGTVIGELMAPSGDKLSVTEYPDEQVEVFPTGEPHWQVYKWFRQVRDGTHGTWLPDSSGIIVRQKPSFAIYSPEGQFMRALPPIPYAQEDWGIRSFRFSPDGEYFYILVVKDSGRSGELYYIKSNEPAAEWQSIGTGLVDSYTVGHKGILAYGYFPSGLLGYHMYLQGERLGERGIWLYNPENKEKVRLTTDYDTAPSISADGKAVAFLRARNHQMGIPQMEVMLLRRQ